MSIRLKSQSYGKSKVRFTKVTRRDELHEVVECLVNVQLDGHFEKTYFTGDNSQVIPTDTIKNTVYAIARQNDWVDIETYGKQLTNHFLDRFEHVSFAYVQIDETLWQRISVDGNPHNHSFVKGQNEVPKCWVQQTRESCSVESRLSGLQVLKTTASGFVGYIVDSYTTLQETTDRIFATSIDAKWSWVSSPSNCNAVRNEVRSIILRMFATEYSPSVQFTIYRIGQAVLEAIPSIQEITLAMPNQHRLLMNMEKIGFDNPNLIFVPTDEPYGDISATISRN